MTMALFDRLGMPEFETGSVWLAGAGPGDPGLMTLLCLYALEQADVVVYDALVSPQVLALAGKGARLIAMGKRGGQPSPKQDAINARLIELARDGLRVLRLKGGDPFVFGRGGEEARGLAAAGVRFRIVPGVTAGIAGTAYAGIPVTNRCTNQVVSFVTGHDQSGQVPPVDWDALAKSSPMIVFYMARKHLSVIRQKLMAAGRGAQEPAALVSKATTPEQRVLDTTLGRCVEDADAADIQAPCIFVLGPAVALRAELAWVTELK